MTDSARTKQDDSTNPVDRPTWRFTGRRGTPVHLREQAPQTLPPEIRKAVTQLARERAGESAPAPDSKPVRAMSELKLGRRDGQAPPVAGAPMPVERRNRSESSEPVVSTSHIPAATAPIAEPSYEAFAEPVIETPVAAMEMPQIEAPAEAPVEVPADVPVVAAETPEVTPTASAIAQAIADATPPAERAAAAEADAAPSPAEAAAESTTPADASPADAAPPADATPTDTKPARRPKLTANERKKLAKARAKAKAKSERAAKKDADGVAAVDKARRLFARGRDVNAAHAAEVEPTIEAIPAEAIPAEATPVEATSVAELLPAGVEASPLEFPIADALTVDAPLPPDVADLPDVIPSLDAMDDVAPPSFPTLEPAAWVELDAHPKADLVDPTADLAVPTSIADVDLGAAVAVDATIDVAEAPLLLEPALATETASQAAWELGRLPFLLHEPTPTATEADLEQSVAIWDVTPSTAALPVRTDDMFEPAAALFQPSIEPSDEPTPLRSSLQPIDWLPVGAQPTPAPIEPMDLPRRAAPDAIQRLSAPLEVPRDTQSLVRAGAREGMTANSRTAEARRRISRRRAELDDLVESLAGLGSGRRDA